MRLWLWMKNAVANWSSGLREILCFLSFFPSTSFLETSEEFTTEQVQKSYVL